MGEDPVYDVATARQYLLRSVEPDTTVEVTVLRGLPHPYASHPRLDLFVGSLSPHTLARMGCTVCHEGQGSGTAFKWTSHTPDGAAQRDQWRQEYGWFNNHHWILPMAPERFVESGCLKCHHEVEELYPSERFPEPPAPKLTQGYELIRDYGCFGCHEINGYKGADTRVGPDMRLAPNYHEVAAALVGDPGFADLDAETQGWARQLVQHPERDGVRRRLMEAVLADRDGDEPVLQDRSHLLADGLADVEAPGKLRKAGPSLRHVGSKVGPAFLYDWIRDPTHFRPSTRMPRFFGNSDHLTEAEQEMVAEFESIEILGITTYLLGRSQSFEPYPLGEFVPNPDDDEMVERGQLMFETRGCLACHQHRDFPDGHATQGPDLSNFGDKLALDDNPDVVGWLYTWLKNPSHYHSRTRMPDLLLDPIEQADGTTTDPAADIAAYLLASKQGWVPAAENAEVLQLATEQTWRAPDELQGALKDLAYQHLRKAFYDVKAKEYLDNGIPAEVGASLKGAEIELVGGATPQHLLNYVGRKAIGKYGCYGCHEVPGFEDAKPIGTGLAEWGRKESSKLAFEHILEYLHTGHGGHGGHAEHAGQGMGEHGAEGHDDTDAEGMLGEIASLEAAELAEPFDESFYDQALMDHERAGFAWQKLKEPRSYDYQKYGPDPTTYNDRLRMPLFPLDDRQREAVLTFVLGLVADPPAEEFVYQPDARQEALIAGRRVLEKYNCGGCHVLNPARWELEFLSGEFETQPEADIYPFLKAHFTPEQLEQSMEQHPLRGTYQATLRGLPAISDDEALPVVLDEDWDPIDPEEEYDPETLVYSFELWEPTAIEGQEYQTGILPINVPAYTIRRQFAAEGGDLAIQLLPRVLEIESAVNPAAKGTETWSWVPPPLMGEGLKVQPDWLHDFLLNPYPIRPAVFLRMPKFNMSPEEASILVDYFAARDGAEFPYSYDPRTQTDHLQQAESSYQQQLAEVAEPPLGDTRLDHAMNMVVDGNYCIKCHLVGDFMPGGSDRAKGPDLARVYQRLRPDYVRAWIANPKTILPYTAMPVNIPYVSNDPNLGGVSQQLYHGTSVEQLDGLVDLLMNYNQYTAQQTQIAPLVEQAAAAAAAAAAGEEESASGSADQ